MAIMVEKHLARETRNPKLGYIRLFLAFLPVASLLAAEPESLKVDIERAIMLSM